MIFITGANGWLGLNLVKSIVEGKTKFLTLFLIQIFAISKVFTTLNSKHEKGSFSHSFDCMAAR